MLEVPAWGLAFWCWFGIGHWSLIHLCSKFRLSILILKLQRTSLSFKSWLELWRTQEFPDWQLESGFQFGYSHWSLIYSWSEFLLFILILKVQRTSMSFKSWFGALEDTGFSWPGNRILILTWTWSLIFDTEMIKILALYLDLAGAKNIHVL